MKSNDYVGLDELLNMLKNEAKRFIENNSEDDDHSGCDHACSKKECSCGKKGEEALQETDENEQEQYVFDKNGIELTFAKDGELDELRAKYNKATKQMQILTTSDLLINNTISAKIKQEISLDLSAVDIDPSTLDVFTTDDPGTVTVTGSLVDDNDSPGIVEILD